MQDAETTESDDGGFRLAFTYKIAGIRTNRAVETSGSGPETDGSGTQHVFDLSGSMTGSYTFNVSEQRAGTRVKFDTQYSFSNRVLDRVTRRFANQYVTRHRDSRSAEDPVSGVRTLLMEAGQFFGDEPRRRCRGTRLQSRR